jgi:hypothetical protein
VQIDGLALRLRARTPLQASDLGVRLCQGTARSVYLSFAVVALPALTLAMAASELALWLPILLTWLMAPWFDRTILFVLSRAAFGQPTTPLDLWRARRQVWWRRAWFTLTVRRLSPWRSLTEPVYGLEGLGLRDARSRVRQLRRRNMRAGLMVTNAFALAELALMAALLSMVVWLAPQGISIDMLFDDSEASTLGLMLSCAYASAVFVLEPFYVAAGFALYLNRRAELEAWDIEQEFRRAVSE